MMKKEKPHKEKKFLKLPSYPGGKAAFLKFIEEHLTYPEEALKNQIEGTVYIEYTVDNIGKVSDITVKHGIGYGCDEEAIRLVRLLKYDPEKNRGVRMKTLMKSRIRFELPSQLKPDPALQYNYVVGEAKKETGSPQDGRTSYEYTITLG